MRLKNYTQNTMKSLLLATGLLLTSSISLFAQDACIEPTNPTITGDLSICEGTDATLSATVEADEVRWYSAATQGDLLHTGFDLTLENLEENTNVWAEGVNIDTEGTTTSGGARINPGSYTGGAAVSPASSPWGLRFNITQDIVLNSVDVFIKSETPGIIVMQLKDRNFQVLEEVMVNTPAGNEDNPLQFTVNLGFEIPAGINYSLVASSSPRMVRESQSNHTGFPYPLGTVGVITQGMLQDTPGASNATTYYFFYNWNLTTFEDCKSDRVAATITVNDIPEMPVGEENQIFIEGESLNDLDVAGTNLTWYADMDGNDELSATTVLIDGATYYVSQSMESCESDFLAITVNLSLGVNDANLGKITISPVPSSDFIFISNIDEINSIEIFNTIGQSVKKFNSINESIYIGDLANGMYVVQLGTSSSVVTKRIIKE